MGAMDNPFSSESIYGVSVLGKQQIPHYLSSHITEPSTYPAGGLESPKNSLELR